MANQLPLTVDGKSSAATYLHVVSKWSFLLQPEFVESLCLQKVSVHFPILKALERYGKCKSKGSMT